MFVNRLTVLQEAKKIGASRGVEVPISALRLFTNLLRELGKLEEFDKRDLSQQEAQMLAQHLVNHFDYVPGCQSSRVH